MNKSNYLFFFSFFLTLSVNAADYSKLVVFGDSLSDPGNFYNASGYPPLPYNKRFTNELVWSEYLSPKIRLESPNIENFAFAGALTNSTNSISDEVGVLLPGVQQQIDSYISNNAALNEDGIYIIWAAVNNILSINSTMTNQDVADLMSAAILDILLHLEKLSNAGAKNLLVIGLPDLGLIPRVNIQGDAAITVLSQISAEFNNVLLSNLNNLPVPVHFLSSAEIMHKVIANPNLYGIANTTDSCLTTESVCDSPDEFIFWDELHLTAAAHKIIADEVFKIIQAARFADTTLKLPSVKIIGETEQFFDVSLTFDPMTGNVKLSDYELINAKDRIAVSSFDTDSGILHAVNVHIDDGKGNDNIVSGTFELLPGGNFEFKFIALD